MVVEKKEEGKAGGVQAGEHGDEDNEFLTRLVNSTYLVLHNCLGVCDGVEELRKVYIIAIDIHH